MLTDTWTAKTAFPYGPRWRAAGTTYNNKGYLIFGRDASNLYHTELYEFNPSASSWSKVTDFPDKGRTYAALKSMDHSLLVLAGIDSTGTSHNDMWRFDLNTLKWSALASIPSEGRRGGICFNNSTTLYYTTGISQTNNRIKETWKVFNPTNIHENEWDKFVEVFPNPSTGQFTLHIQTSELRINSLELQNPVGQTLWSMDGSFVSDQALEIDLTDLSKGLYLLSLKSQQGIILKKIIKK